jgi:Bax protein
LKRHGLWHIKKNAQVKPVVFNRFPLRSAEKLRSESKKIFFHVLLPAALITSAEIKQERQFIIESIAQINNDAECIDFDPEISDWQQKLTLASVNRLIDISKKYEEENAASLLTKVDVIPVSLILAQSAIESAWGGSRFAVQGNNMFGIWTWGDDGMIPEERADGMSHKVAVFDSLLDSVRAYALMLNRLTVYQHFRDIRSETRDSLELAEGLINYSSRRDRYVNDVKTMIRQNFLRKYDTNTLASGI